MTTLSERLLPLLIRDFGFREAGEFLRQGTCPECGRRELYTLRARPRVLKCGRLNKCAAEIEVKGLYPDLFDDWSRSAPPTKENPRASAEAYLRDGRGFDLDLLARWGVAFTQESFWDRGRNAGSATVRFALGNGVAWERIIDRPARFGSRKATFIGAYGGTAWSAPRGPGGDGDVWIVEGVFDALSLMHHGVAALAAMSAQNYPHLTLAAIDAQCQAAGRPRPRLVWALDNDAAGRPFIRKHVARARKEGWTCAAALIETNDGNKLDWNDAHLRERLEKHHLASYRYAGDLFLAPSAIEKAILIHQHETRFAFPFDFDSRLYWFELDRDAQQRLARDEVDTQRGDEETMRRLREAGRLTQICNCLPCPRYYVENKATDEAWYYFRITFPDGTKPVTKSFTARQMASAPEFRARLLHAAQWALWTGRQGHLDALFRKWEKVKKRVETLDFVGYSREHGAYVFHDFAFSGGRMFEKNADGFFEIGKTSIMTLSRIDRMEIAPAPENDAPGEWRMPFWTAFGELGVIALGFWLGCLFAEQIRARHESFPFLEIVGDPGAGKTTMIEFLWKLLGRANYEGFDPMKASGVGFLRAMAQSSNLPVVLIESDREGDPDNHAGRSPSTFAWDALKSLYNGGGLRTTGVKSAGHDTIEPQFRAALVISQNWTVRASQAVMERIVCLSMSKTRLSAGGREAARALSRKSAREMSAFISRALTLEAPILADFESRLPDFEKALAGAGVKNQRLIKNYAQVASLIACLPRAARIDAEHAKAAVARLMRLAIQREEDLARDHPVVERFWEIYDYLNGTPTGDDPADVEENFRPRLNHSRDPRRIAVNLNHFLQLANEHRQNAPDIAELKKYLKTSKSRPFVEAKAVVSSAINAQYNAERSVNMPPRPASTRCWVFSAGRVSGEECGEK